MTRASRLLGLGLAASIVLAAGYSVHAEVGVTEREIRVGSCTGLTGPNKDSGTELLNGAMAYIQYVNERGGVHGRKITVLSFDDAFDPEKAILCFGQLQKEEVFALAFAYGAAPAVKYTSMAEAGKIPFIAGGTGAKFLYHPVKRYVFNVRASFADETEDLLDHLWNDLGLRKVSAIYPNDAAGSGWLDAVKQSLTRRELALASVAAYPRDSVDVLEAMRSTRRENPEAVLLLGSYAGSVEVVKRAKAEGWNPVFVSFGGRDTFVRAAGEAAEGAIVSQVVPSPDRGDLSTVRLYNRLLKKYSAGTAPGYYGLEGFLDAMILVEGLELAGENPTRENFIDALESIHNHEIGLGKKFLVNFGKNDHGALDRSFATIVHDGRLFAVDDWKKLKR